MSVIFSVAKKPRNDYVTDAPDVNSAHSEVFLFKRIWIMTKLFGRGIESSFHS